MAGNKKIEGETFADHNMPAQLGQYRKPFLYLLRAEVNKCKASEFLGGRI